MSVEDALRSNASFVLVEAPGGCGKTHTAAEYARFIAPRLPDTQRILVLAHTNAAVHEFSIRTKDLRHRVKVSTFDAFALRIITPYAEALGVGSPIKVGMGRDQVPPEQLSQLAATLLGRCSIIARILSSAYPAIVLDEHQDSSESQHSIAMALRAAGSKVRGFGDPMQQIFGEGALPWERLLDDADVVQTLDVPHRWRDAPQLGEWILRAREELRRGRGLPLGDAPREVHVERTNVPDIGFRAGIPVQYSRFVLGLPSGSKGLLTARRNHMYTLRSASRSTAAIYEGSDFEHLYAAVDSTVGGTGNALQLCGVLLDLLSGVSTGLTAARRARIHASLGADAIVAGRRHEVSPLIEHLELIYKCPTVVGVGGAARAILANTPAWLRIDRPAALRILGTIIAAKNEIHEQLHEVITEYKAAAENPEFAVSTVHRSKGLEYDHVLVSNVSSSHFPDDDAGRRLLYVAISRCRRSLRLLVPADAPSRLVP